MKQLAKEMLVENYEQLRGQAMGESPQAGRLRLGLALFIHKGMTAWLEAWADNPPQTEPRSTMKRTVANPLPDRLHDDVTIVLSNMVMSIGLQEANYDYAINSEGNKRPSQTECLSLCSPVYDEAGIGASGEHQTSICSAATG
jgi:hypothetical protein